MEVAVDLHVDGDCSQSSGDVMCERQFDTSRGNRQSCRLSSQRKSNRSGLPPVTAAVRQRLQAVFEHAQRSAEKADYDYAHDLFTQCLVEDPANLIYLQHFLGNLAQKYGNNKKGSRFAGAEEQNARG